MGVADWRCHCTNDGELDDGVATRREVLLGGPLVAAGMAASNEAGADELPDYLSTEDIANRCTECAATGVVLCRSHFSLSLNL